MHPLHLLKEAIINSIEEVNCVEFARIINEVKAENGLAPVMTGLLQSFQENDGLGILQTIILKEEQLKKEIRRLETECEKLDDVKKGKLKEKITGIRDKSYAALRILERLLQEETIAKFLINKVDKSGQLPIECAIKSDLIGEVNEGSDCLRVMMKYGADIQVRGKNNKTALHFLCENENASREKLKVIFGKFKKKIEVKYDKVNKKNNQPSWFAFLNELSKQDDRGNSVLHVASNHIIEAINNSCVDINHRSRVINELCDKKNIDGLSPITLAIRNKRNGVLDEILKLDGITNKITKNLRLRNEVIDECILSGNTQALEKIVTKIDKSTKDQLIKEFGIRNFDEGFGEPNKSMLHKLVKNSDSETIDALVRNHHDPFKQRIAEVVVEVGNMSIFRHLNRENDLVDMLGNNELHIIAQSTIPEISILSSGNALKVIAKNKKNQTPIELAIKHNNLEFVREMLDLYQKEASFVGRNPAVDLALKQAALIGNIDALRMLVENYNADIYHIFENDKTLIEVAAMGENSQQTIQYIMSEHRKKPKEERITDGINRTVIGILPNQREQEWHRELLKFANLTNDDLNRASEYGNPINKAVENGNYHLVEFLNERFPDLKREQVDRENFFDQQAPIDFVKNLGDVEAANILGVTVDLTKSFLSGMRAKHDERKRIVKNDESVAQEEKVFSKKNGASIDLLYQYNGNLEEYASLIRNFKSLESKLQDIDKENAKELFDQRSPAGHNLATLVATFGTVSHWKEVKKVWNKIDSSERPTAHLHELSSEFGSSVDVAIRSVNEGVIKEIQKSGTGVKILKTAVEIGGLNLVRQDLDKLSSLDKKIEAILEVSKDSPKKNLLHIAIERGDHAMVGELIFQIKASNINEKQAQRLSESLCARDVNGETILSAAANQKDPGIFSSVYDLVQFADENTNGRRLYIEHIHDEKGGTVLDLAFKNGNFLAVETLLNKLDSTINRGKGSNRFVEKAKSTRIMGFKNIVTQSNCDVSMIRNLIPDQNLMSEGDFKDFLPEVVEKGNSKVLESLLKERDLIHDIEFKQVLLESAIKAGNIENIDWLISNKGVEINGKVSTELDKTLFDVALENPRLHSWCGQYLRESNDIQHPLSKALQLGDLKTIESLAQGYRGDLLEEIDGKLLIDIASENGVDEDIVLTIADNLLKSANITFEQIKKVSKVLQKHGYCKNDDYFSILVSESFSSEKRVESETEVISSILENAVENGNSIIVKNLLDRFSYDVSSIYSALNTLLRNAVRLGNVEITNIILNKISREEAREVIYLGDSSLLKQVVLGGDYELFTALTREDLGLGFRLGGVANHKKKEWADTFARGGMLNEFKNVVESLDIIDQNGNKGVNVVDQSSLLHAILDGGHANKEMIEYYKTKFSDHYTEEMLLPQASEVTEKKILRADKTRRIPLWEEAQKSGNEELANYLKCDGIQKLQNSNPNPRKKPIEDIKEGEINKSSLSRAFSMNEKLFTDYTKEDKSPDEVKKMISQIGSARSIRKRDFVRGHEIIHRKSESVRLKCKELIKCIESNDIKRANKICADNPGILDIYNSEMQKTITDLVFEHGTNEMKLELSDYINLWLTDKDGNTPLHKVLENASRYTQKELSSFIDNMVKHGAPLNCENNNGKSAASLIAEHKDFELGSKFGVKIGAIAMKQMKIDNKVRDELDKLKNNEGIGSLIAMLNHHDNPILYTSEVASRCFDNESKLDESKIVDQRIADLKKIFNNDEGFNPFQGVDSNGNTLLHLLCEKVIISDDPSLIDAFGSVMSILLNHQRFKAEMLSVKNLNNETPLDILAKSPHSIQAFKFFEKNESERGNPGVASVEIVREVDLNCLLRRAAKYGNIELCKHLLSGSKYRNLDINAIGSDVDDDSALHQAARNGKFHIFKYLLGSGANIDQVDKNNRTVLQVLLGRLHSGDAKNPDDILRMIHTLIANGADLNTNKDRSGSSAIDLIQAIEYGSKLMSTELTQLREKKVVGELLSVKQEEKLDFLQSSNGYIKATSNIVQQVLELQKTLLDNEKKLNDQLKSAITETGMVHDDFHVGPVPVPFSSKARDKMSQLFPNKDNNYTARINGGIVQLDIYSIKGGVIVSEFFNNEVIKNSNIRTCKINCETYKASVQKSENGKRNYTVEEGSMNMEVRGINGEPRIVVIMSSDGKIKGYNKGGIALDPKKLNKTEVSGLRNVYVGGILLYDALVQGKWREVSGKSTKNMVNKPKSHISSLNDLPDPDMGKRGDVSNKNTKESGLLSPDSVNHLEDFQLEEKKIDPDAQDVFFASDVVTGEQKRTMESQFSTEGLSMADAGVVDEKVVKNIIKQHSSTTEMPKIQQRESNPCDKLSIINGKDKGGLVDVSQSVTDSLSKLLNNLKDSTKDNDQSQIGILQDAINNLKKADNDGSVRNEKGQDGILQQLINEIQEGRDIKKYVEKLKKSSYEKKGGDSVVESSLEFLDRGEEHKREFYDGVKGLANALNNLCKSLLDSREGMGKLKKSPKGQYDSEILTNLEDVLSIKEKFEVLKLKENGEKAESISNSSVLEKTLFDSGGRTDSMSSKEAIKVAQESIKSTPLSCSENTQPVRPDQSIMNNSNSRGQIVK